MIVYTCPEDLSKWDVRFLALANHVGQWSKGPRKFIGSVIVRPERTIAATGYNGPPRGFDDSAFLAMTREDQHRFVIHAERNALDFLTPHDLSRLECERNGYTLYVSPLLPCHECAQAIADAGIRRVVAECGHISPDWAASARLAEEVFVRNNVECTFVFI